MLFFFHFTNNLKCLKDNIEIVNSVVDELDIVDFFKDSITTESKLIEERNIAIQKLEEEERNFDIKEIKEKEHRERCSNFKAPAGVPPKYLTNPVPVVAEIQTTKKRGKRSTKITIEEYLKLTHGDAKDSSIKSKKSKLDKRQSGI